MTRTLCRSALLSVVSVVIVLVLVLAGPSRMTPRLSGQAPQSGQPSPKNGEWPSYNADVHGSRYSPLEQINASNFNKLEVAWRFKTDNLGPFALSLLR